MMRAMYENEDNYGLTHDQIIARLQKFYEFLMADYFEYRNESFASLMQDHVDKYLELFDEIISTD